MLTATYTMVTLSVEQASIRMGLQALQKYVQVHLLQRHSTTLAQLEHAFVTLDSLYQACRLRKSEICLIPAIRLATERADYLLAELSTLNAAVSDTMHQLRVRLDTMGANSEECVEHICSSIDACCSTLLRRLEKEEQELYAMARSVICGEAWFSMASQFMLHDAEKIETRRSKASVVELPLPVGMNICADVASNWPLHSPLKVVGGE
jgi:hypothetical protein